MCVRALINYTRSINPLVILSGLDILSEHSVCMSIEGNSLLCSSSP